MDNPEEITSDMIPIRKPTAKLLSRPLEPDFTVIGALTYAISICVYVYTLYVQLSSIVGVCSNSYMCPFQTATSGLPVVAPPVEFRVGAAATVQLEEADLNTYRTKYYPWQPKLAESCLLGEPNCEDPGYLVQWPYIEMNSRDAADRNFETEEFPLGLVDEGCVQERGDEGSPEGWSYDPIRKRLRAEYYRCPEAEYIPFLSVYESVNGTVGETTFHFKPAYYVDNHKFTLECMDEVLLDPKYGGISRDQWLTTNAALETEKKQELQSCMAGKSVTESNMCECTQHNWKKWAFGLYFPGRSRTKTCRKGEYDGEVCQTPDLVETLNNGFSAATTDAGALTKCTNGDGCLPVFHHEEPLQKSSYYGCFFTTMRSFHSEGATVPLPVQYHTCGTAYSTSSNQYAKSDTLLKLQSSLDLIISKRSMLVTVFLIKEGCLITAMVIMPVICLILLVVSAVLYYLIILPLKLMFNACNLGLDFTINSIIVMVKEIIFIQLTILYTMCINFSTLYRCTLLAIALWKGLVNPSIRDLDTKMTTVANTVFSLVLLLALSEGNADRNIVISLVLSLVQLLYAMNTEKIRLSYISEPLKDLNENRLNKFEFALLITKMMEDMLDDDVQYNWVQLFNSDQPLKPFDLTFPETLGSSEFDFKRQIYLNHEAISGKISKNFEERFDDILFNWILGDKQLKNQMVAKLWLQDIPKDLVKQFGSDGQTMPDKNNKIVNKENENDSIQWKDTGRKMWEKDKIVTVELKETFSEKKLLLGDTFSAARSSPLVDDFFSKPLLQHGQGFAEAHMAELGTLTTKKTTARKRSNVGANTTFSPSPSAGGAGGVGSPASPPGGVGDTSQDMGRVV
mmetsp:Transcript_53978/g.110155  ORF Transcript_53978/g.110155 Transcript_53978/m.110155 type:complete len:852 (+) Transcript_53978:538-3093(+)